MTGSSAAHEAVAFFRAATCVAARNPAKPANYFFLPPNASAAASGSPALPLCATGVVARLTMSAMESVVFRITSAVVSSISRGFKAGTLIASIVRSTISEPVRVMLSRVDFLEESIWVDRVLEMASKAPQKRLITSCESVTAPRAFCICCMLNNVTALVNRIIEEVSSRRPVSCPFASLAGELCDFIVSLSPQNYHARKPSPRLVLRYYTLVIVQIYFAGEHSHVNAFSWIQRQWPEMAGRSAAGSKNVQSEQAWLQ